MKYAHLSKEDITSILNSISSTMAVIDYNGRILHVNTAWIEFAKNNSDNKDQVPFIDYNYFDVCTQDLNDKDALFVLKNLKDLMAGKLDRFDYEYPCNSPDQERWFLMRTVRRKSNKKELIISHIDISQQKFAEKELENLKNHLEILVKERTKALDEKNKELENFNSLFVGRELRMKELKDQVKELKQEITDLKNPS